MRVPSSVAGVVLFPFVMVRRVVCRVVRWLAAAVRRVLQRVVRRRDPSRDEVLGLLRRHREELSRTPREVLVTAEGAGVSRRTLQRWLRRHGVKRLELSLDAGLGDADLRTHLSGGSLPPEWALEMLARQDGPVGGR